MRKVAFLALPMWFAISVSIVSADQQKTVADFLAECARNSKAWSACSFAVSTVGVFDETKHARNPQSLPPEKFDGSRDGDGNNLGHQLAACASRHRHHDAIGWYLSLDSHCKAESSHH